MRTLWMFVPGLVVVAGAVVLAELPDHPARVIYCDSLVVRDNETFPACPIRVDHRRAEVEVTAGLGVVALLGAGGVAWSRHRRDAVADSEPALES